MNNAMEFMHKSEQKSPVVIKIVLRFSARRMYFHSNFSVPLLIISSMIRFLANLRSSSFRKEAVPGVLGRTKKATTPRTIVKIPSKKKILRQVCMIPQGGILERPVARSPPKAPERLANEA